MPKSRSPLGLQTVLGAAERALLWVQEQECYSSCITAKQDSKFSLLALLCCVYEPQIVFWILSHIHITI